MAKALKIIGIIVAAIIALFIVAGVLLTQLVDPNKYKSNISKQVYQHTGHRLAINGKISWSFFPWLGLSVKNVALSNTQRFGGGNMATIKEADVSVAVIPLFSGQVTVGKLTLNGLNLTLIKDRSGYGNWQSLMQSKAAPAPAPAKTSAPAKPAKKSTKAMPNFDVQVVDVSNGSIHWLDQQHGMDSTLKNIEIHGKNIGFGHPFSIDMSAYVDSKKPGVKANIKLGGNFTIAGNANNMMSALNGSGKFSLTNGIIQGVNLGYQLQRASALISGKPQPHSDSKVTKIGHMDGTFNIKRGILTNKDLTVETPLTKATGTGTVNLPAQNMDYTLYLVPVRSSALKGKRIPFHVFGPLANLSYKLEIDGLVKKYAQSRIKQEAKKYLDSDKFKQQGKKLLSGLFK